MTWILQDVNAEKIVECAEAVSYGASDTDAIAHYIGQTKAHTSKIVGMALHLGLVETRNGVFVIGEADAKLIRSLTPVERPTYFLKYLKRFEPFSFFYHLLSIGCTPLEAARKVSAIYRIDRAPESILKMFRTWGIFAGIFESGPGLIRADLVNKSTPTIDNLRRALESELASEEYLKQILGKEALQSLDAEDRRELVMAMTEVEANPRGAMKKAREVLEDYLGDYGRAVGVDVSDKPTLNGKVEKLRQNGKLARKHVPTLEGLEVLMEEQTMKGLGAYGNLSHHGNIDDDQKRWSLSSEIAICVLLQTILTISSIHNYGFKGRTAY
jgi:hypothetical protein